MGSPGRGRWLAGLAIAGAVIVCADSLRWWTANGTRPETKPQAAVRSIVDALALTPEQHQAADPVLKAYEQKLDAARDELMTGMKGVLDPQRYERFKEAMGVRDTDVAAKRVAVTFDGGHETDGRDGGRPVVLIAAALGVSPDVFREAFSKVNPAVGKEPTPDQVRANKQVLLGALQKYRVTNERLDDVSDYYRYRRDLDQMWPTRSAKGYAIVQDGKIIKFIVEDGGAGYTSAPEVTVPGVDGIKGVGIVGFSTELEQNGRVKDIRIWGQ